MHICFITQEYPPETGWGGIGAYTHDLARGLVERGQQVSVISLAPGRSESSRMVDGIRVDRVCPRPDWARWPGLWRLNHIWPGFAWAARKRVCMLHRQTPIDVIEAPENRADSFLVKSFCKGPAHVVRLHTASRFVDELNQKQPSLRWRLTYRQEGWVLRHADLVTAPSRAVVELTQRAYTLPDRVRVIPNPVDSQLFHPDGQGKRDDVLFVGRLEAHKGAGILCAVLPPLLKALPDLQVRIAGSDTQDHVGRSWKARLLEAIPAPDRRRVTISSVPRTEMPALYAGARVVLVPSLWESFSYVVAESMACGTPVVASAVGGIPSLVVEGETGFLVPPEDHPLFVRRIRQLLRDPSRAAAMGRMARKRVERTYSLQAVIPRMLEIYQGLCHHD